MTPAALRERLVSIRELLAAADGAEALDEYATAALDAVARLILDLDAEELRKPTV